MLPSPTPKSDAGRAQAVDLLNPLALEAVSVSLLARMAHWNVRGPAFGPLHELFGEVYDAMSGHADRIAERVATLGGIALGEVALQKGVNVTIPALGALDGLTMCGPVADALDAFSKRCGAAFDRLTEARFTADTNALQDVIESVEKLSWKVRSHIITA